MSDRWLFTYDVLIFKWAFSSTVLCFLLAAICRSLRFNPNIWHIPRNIIRFFVYLKRGKRYIANINGTWRIVKGKISSSGSLHTIKLFPENESYCLSEDEFRKIAVTESEDEIRDKLIAWNLRNLKNRYPLPIDDRPQHLRTQDPFAEEIRRRIRITNDPTDELMNDLMPINYLTPELRRQVETTLAEGILPRQSLISDEDEWRF